jgi:hypothetical protein
MSDRARFASLILQVQSFSQNIRDSNHVSLLHALHKVAIVTIPLPKLSYCFCNTMTCTNLVSDLDIALVYSVLILPSLLHVLIQYRV